MKTSWIWICVSLLFMGCAQQADTPTSSPSSSSEGWSTLETLDAEVDALTELLKEDADTAEVAIHVNEVQEAIQAVVDGGVPTSVEQPDLVEEKLADLGSLTAELQRDPATLAAVTPLISSLKEAAGIAEACPHCGGHHGEDADHDH